MTPKSYELTIIETGAIIRVYKCRRCAVKRLFKLTRAGQNARLVLIY